MNIFKHLRLILIIGIIFSSLSSCRHDIIIWPTDQEQIGSSQTTSISAFYLLNEGNWGSNKCTLDHYDYATATYTRNIYSWANPSVVAGLGDVGNDLQVYGSRLWAIINCSNKIEVIDARTASRVGQVNLASPRYIAFHQGYAYVTSYAGPVQEGNSYNQLGIVVKIDTLTLEKVDTCVVGFQPDGIAVVGNRLYVANSGGYLVPNYENTLSVIDLQTFSETGRIAVDTNLHRILPDKYGNLWVSSRSDYYDKPSALYRISNLNDTPLINHISASNSSNIVVSNMALKGDSLFVIGNDFSYTTNLATRNFAIVNVRTAQVLTTNFISDDTDNEILDAYGLAVNPYSGEIFITDANGYVNPGILRCYSPQGLLQWKIRTGDIPAHIAFMP
jgi:hypothetical protein